MDTPQVNGEPEHPPETPHTPVMESMTRLVKIPVVEKTLHAATDVYEKVKEASPALNWTLSTAESTVNKAVESAMPLTAKLEKPLKTVDNLLCSSLDYVESHVPAVKLPPQEILDTTKSIVQEKAAATKSIVQEKAAATKTIVQEKAAAVKEYGERRLSFVRTMSLDRQGAALLAQNCKDLATSGMEKAKDVAHRLMSPKESEEEIEEVFFFSFFFAAWVQQSPRRRRHSPHRILTPEMLRQSLQPCNTMAMVSSPRHPMLCATNFDFLHLSIALPPMLTVFLAPFRRKLPPPPPIKIRELELIEELEE